VVACRHPRGLRDTLTRGKQAPVPQAPGSSNKR
jgi:hypothetical protein